MEVEVGAGGRELGEEEEVSKPGVETRKRLIVRSWVDDLNVEGERMTKTVGVVNTDKDRAVTEQSGLLGTLSLFKQNAY